jgi:hypothetical protein
VIEIGVKKAKVKTTAKKSKSAISNVISGASSLIRGATGVKRASGGMRRHHRVTPESLAKKILILKLKKKLYKMKYGGR